MIDNDGRVCSKCQVWKPWSEYHRNRDGPNGYCSHCKDCRSVSRKQWRENETEHRTRLNAKYAEREQLAKQGLKRCSKCSDIKPTKQFSIDRRKWDGLQSQCRACYLDQKRTPQYSDKLWLRERRLKRCSRCKKVKLFADYYKNPNMTDGCQSQCKTCIREQRAPTIIERERLRKMNLKRCIACKQIKFLGAFNRYAASLDGRTSYCRECSRNFSREWGQQNPMKVRIQARTRRARKLAVGGNFTEEDIQELYGSQDGICTYFGFDPECHGDLSPDFHIDHIIPLSRTELHPSNSIENLQLLCPHCNAAKWSRTHEEFLAWLQQNT